MRTASAIIVVCCSSVTVQVDETEMISEMFSHVKPNRYNFADWQTRNKKKVIIIASITSPCISLEISVDLKIESTGLDGNNTGNGIIIL